MQARTSLDLVPPRGMVSCMEAPHKSGRPGSEGDVGHEHRTEDHGLRRRPGCDLRHGLRRRRGHRPRRRRQPAETQGRAHPASPRPEEAGGHTGHDTPPAGGLQISEDGYTLDLQTPSVTAGQRSDLRFTVRDGGGRAVTAYQREHEKELHLIVASRDLVTYRHLHPTRAADGTWSTPVDLPRAGGYRVFADFTPAKKDAGTSPSARTSPPPARTSRRNCPHRAPRPRPTGTR